MKKLLPLIFGTLLAGAAFAQTPDTPTFVNTAASSDMYEIRSSEMALQMSQTEGVKTFAQQIIADHTKASQELVQAAAPDMVPAAEMLPKHQQMLAELQAAGTANFDAVYAQQQQAAHTEAVALFQGYAQAGEDPEVKAFAEKTLPVLQMHLDHAKSLPSS